MAHLDDACFPHDEGRRALRARRADERNVHPVVRPSRVFEPVISFDDPILVPDRFGYSRATVRVQYKTATSVRVLQFALYTYVYSTFTVRVHVLVRLLHYLWNRINNFYSIIKSGISSLRVQLYM